MNILFIIVFLHEKNKTFFLINSKKGLKGHLLIEKSWIYESLTLSPAHHGCLC